MATVSSFDQWQKDVFFSAAEEVQESTDKLESVYRMWVRLGINESELSEDLFRELRIALGTAKWQLDEFERAVCLRQEDPSAEKYRVTRHKEFVSVIGNQISQIEKEVNSSLQESKQSLSWVQLDKEERDDLANFLSTPPKALQGTKGRHTNQVGSKGFRETLTINKDSRYVVEVAACKSKVETLLQDDRLDEGSGRWSSPDIGAWKIMIADEEELDKEIVEKKSEAPSHALRLSGFVMGVQSTAKSKMSRKSFLKDKRRDNLPLTRGLSNYLDLKGITQFAKGINGLSERSRNYFSKYSEDPKISNDQHLVGKAGVLHRHTPSSQNCMQFGRSLRITILLLLSIILVVPFALYST